MAEKPVYFFGGGRAEGNGSMRELLGGKGANLHEMAGQPDLLLPVPPGFTITAEVCTYYLDEKRYPEQLKKEVSSALKDIEGLAGKQFGSPENPLLVSVRSGARISMPGMMETVLNAGLTEKTIPGLIRQTGDERFVYDAYRRLIMMYADVVMEKAAGIEPENGEMGIRRQLERILESLKKNKGIISDTELSAEDLKQLCSDFKRKIKEVLKKEFPDDHETQLWEAISAVFASWNGKRAVAYRRIENIPDNWGTAVNVQAMVFGNMGDTSATGVAFTRNPGNGENEFYGEYLANAQGEDVVAGIRTPAPLNEYSKTDHNKDLISLEKHMPEIYRELFDIQKKLEKHYKDMQDIEFTIEKGRLYILQCRVGKRNGPAAVRMAVDMHREGLITKETAISRVTPLQLDEMLHPVIDPNEEMGKRPLARGLPAGPGAAAGQAVFSAADAVGWAKRGKKVILIREETNPEDVEGMRAAQAILTARGGVTSHAALVSRGWGKCCIVGCGAIHIDYNSKQFSADGRVIREGDWITLNGTKGNIYEGSLQMINPSEENGTLNEFLLLCDSIRKLKIRANADTPEDALKGKSFGAEGIGLFRMEHMFYGKGSEKPLFLLRKMIISKTEEERKKALTELYPFMKDDIKATMEVMDGLPVTIRLLDPPLHEFVPHEGEKFGELAGSLGVTVEELENRARFLRETNPMMGHRGVRLGITYPEISEMQIKAIFEASAELMKEGRKVEPEIMIPVVMGTEELMHQFAISERICRETLEKFGIREIPHLVGTMIEIPRASLLAGRLAEVSEFFSFGTNDMTQLGFGFSRDDTGSFFPHYLEKGILDKDPFQTIDEEGIGELIKIGIDRGRKARPNLKIGICGEHGGDAESVKFCHRVRMDYVSCSPFRVPIARLAAAQAAVEDKATS